MNGLSSFSFSFTTQSPYSLIHTHTSPPQTCSYTLIVQHQLQTGVQHRAPGMDMSSAGDQTAEVWITWSQGVPGPGPRLRTSSVHHTHIYTYWQVSPVNLTTGECLWMLGESRSTWRKPTASNWNQKMDLVEMQRDTESEDNKSVVLGKQSKCWVSLFSPSSCQQNTCQLPVQVLDWKYFIACPRKWPRKLSKVEQ